MKFRCVILSSLVALAACGRTTFCKGIDESAAGLSRFDFEVQNARAFRTLACNPDFDVGPFWNSAACMRFNRLARPGDDLAELWFFGEEAPRTMHYSIVRDRCVFAVFPTGLAR
jgi:hypothetical protein